MNLGNDSFDILVVGGGHAGCEAALCAARLGLKTLVVTGSIDRIAAMSCNPAIGGVGKGHLVKEIDALGGQMAKIADDTGIHFRTLNASRGPAVQATRCQSDMERYRQEMLKVLLETPNLFLRQDDVISLTTRPDGHISGILTKHSGEIKARRVILTTGTFLQGQLHLGTQQTPGGRAGEAPTRGLSASLKELGLELGRLKTGTCPRLDARTIDYSALEEQKPDLPAPRFSFEATPPKLPQVSCFLTYTNPTTHDIIGSAVSDGLAPIYNGQIGSAGPRYCPSIEDKIHRFREKSSHLIFLEPHGLDTYEIYPNGLSTSLPPEFQLRFLRSMKGLENVHVTRWGYAVEYDFVKPTQLYSTLETKSVKGLYCAGQINGTTGYEEAAAQGLLAGLNASMSLLDKAPIVLSRSQAYLGVLVDDLVTLGTEEPYRMFTSRAEHRLILREDNVYKRLMDVGYHSGLLPRERYERMQEFEAKVDHEKAQLSSTKLEPSEATNAILSELNSTPLSEPISKATLIRRPEITVDVSMRLFESQTDRRVFSRALIEEKYAGYIERAQKQLVNEVELEGIEIPESLFESRSSGMSHEVFQKLCAVRPRTLGQASRISGMTKAGLALVLVRVKQLSASL
jgi:tRNA uridine 5-carboxymethylaminomethyl modification enzyme